MTIILHIKLFKKMKKLIVLLYLNCLAAVGYSIIAPIYPIKALENGLSEKIVGIVISLFALSSVFVIPISLKIIKTLGRKRALYITVLLNVK